MQFIVNGKHDLAYSCHWNASRLKGIRGQLVENASPFVIICDKTSEYAEHICKRNYEYICNKIYSEKFLVFCETKRFYEKEHF